MPGPGQTRDGSRRTALRDYFAANPGPHRAMEVAAALGVPPGKARTQLANELARLARDGVVAREQVPVEGRATPVTVYRAIT